MSNVLTSEPDWQTIKVDYIQLKIPFQLNSHHESLWSHCQPSDSSLSTRPFSSCQVGSGLWRFDSNWAISVHLSVNLTQTTSRMVFESFGHSERVCVHESATMRHEWNRMKVKKKSWLKGKRRKKPTHTHTHTHTFDFYGRHWLTRQG